MRIKVPVHIHLDVQYGGYSVSSWEASEGGTYKELAYFPDMEFEVVDHSENLIRIEALKERKKQIQEDAENDIHNIDTKIQHLMALPHEGE